MPLFRRLLLCGRLYVGGSYAPLPFQRDVHHISSYLRDVKAT
jgi:hypothetical protein